MVSPREREEQGQPTQEPTIRLEHVSKIYQMGKVQVRALDDISLEVWPGEFIVFLGPAARARPPC